MTELFSSVFSNDATRLSQLMHSDQHKDLLHHCFGLLLHVSNLIKHPQITQCLEQYGSLLEARSAELQKQDDSVSTHLDLVIGDCLSYLVSTLPVSCLAELIKIGLPLDICDLDGKGLVHHAAAVNSADCIRLLIDHHVDVDSLDAHSITPLMIACRGGNLQSAGVLVECTEKLNHHDVNGETALHYACKSGNQQVVKLLLEAGISFAMNTKGENELMIALSRDYEEIAILLTEFGIDTKVKNRQQSTALHYAAKFDCPSVVEHLEACPIQKDSHGYSPFAVAAKNGHHRTLKALLESRPQKDLFDMETMTHNSPLQLATMMGQSECVELLLNAGATVDYQNCLSLAVHSGNSTVLSLLINKYKSDLGAEWQFTGMDSINKLGMSPLHVAAMYGHDDCVKLLLAEGAYPWQCMPVTGETPLMLAIIKNYHRCAKIIIGTAEMDGSFGLNCMTPKRNTALHYAAMQGAYECVHLLIDAGAALNIKDVKGCTPLLLAVENGHLDTVKLLLAARCAVNVTNQHGLNALHVAAANNDADCVQCLLQARLDPNSMSWITRVSPAIVAAGKGYKEVLRLLLDFDADITLDDAKGQTPLHHAAKNDHADCIHLLIMYNSPVEVQDKAGHTPTILAAIHGSIHALTMLILYNGDVSDFEFEKMQSSQRYAEVLWLLLHTNFRLRYRLRSLMPPSPGDIDADQRTLLDDVLCDLVDFSWSLKDMCRIVIRRSMGQGIEFVNGVNVLPLPRELRRYIAMEEECGKFEALKY